MHASARCLPPLAAVALFALVFGPGCTRQFYRQRADQDVEGTITQKNVFPDWQVRNWHVYPDQRARFADESNPDRPPYPPDDYAARVLSPNPQKPTKKSGVGRVDGTGYIALLESWDAQNRAEDGNAGARGAGPQYTPQQTAELSGASAKPQLTQPAPAAQVAPVRPFAYAPVRPLPPPTVLDGDRPAVRHALPSGFRGSVSTGTDAESVAANPEPQGPAAPAPVAKPAAPEFGPWVAAKPHMPGPVVTNRGGGPTITELRPPVVMIAVGDAESNGKTVPAIAVAPIGGAGQPDPAPMKQPEPEPPVKQPDPKPMPQPLPEPLQPAKQPEPKPGGPVGQRPGAGAAAGDPAADYLRALESDQLGYRLKLEQAVELGVLNAREFQDRREDLYLAALDVTRARFTFAAQGFFTEQAIRESVGDALNPNFRGSERETFNTNIGFTKRFATNALLTLRVANQVLVDLSGDRPTTSVSNLTLSLFQPFLRGGGKTIALEDLTQSERTLVYAMRSFMRFRRLFFVAIAAGPASPLGYTNNPYGLQGLSQNLGRGIGGNLTSPNVGYLPLLQQLAILNNQQRNVTALEDLLRIYQEYRDGGQFSRLQVDQVEVQLLNSRGQLLGSPGGGGGGRRQFLDSLDNFKLQLGLPVTVPLELNDAPLRPIYQQLNRLEELLAQGRALDLESERPVPNLPIADFRARWRNLFTNSPLVRGTRFAKTIVERWESWSPAKLTQDQVDARLKALRDEKEKLLDAQVDRRLKGVPEPEAELRRLEAIKADIDLGVFESAVRAYEAQPWLKKGKEAAAEQSVAFSKVVSAFQLVIIEALNERLEAARRQWPELPPLPVGGSDVLETSLDEAYTAAVQAALTARLDLMNARAQVVDAWRQIAVTANSLQGVLNVQYDLQSGTPADGNNPVGFSADRSRNRLTINAELPLVRRAERNVYRASLITYQRQRRTLMAFEDNIATDVRGDVRDLRTFAQLYRIQQRVVELGYAQVDLARRTQFAPKEFGAQAQPAADAALTQQLLSAQSNLLQGQNQLFQIWVSYQTARMNLYLDLEQIQLDDRGVWCDEFFNRADRQERTSPDDRPAGERIPAPRPLDDGTPK